MDDFLRVMQVVNSAVVIVAILGAPFFIVWGRRYFADRGSPEAVRDTLHQELREMESRIRQELNNGISSVSAHSIQQFGSISTQLTDVKRAMDQALERAHTAHDHAQAAIHKAERADDKITALDRLLTERLNHLVSQVRGIEELIRHGASAAQKQHGRGG